MRYSSRCLSIALILIQVCALAPCPLSAAGTTFEEVRGFSRERLDLAFARADREKTPARWLSGAEGALSPLFASWEEVALELYADDGERSEARRLLSEAAAEELSERFASWLHGQFLSGAAEKLREAVASSIHGATLGALYQKGPDGELLLDAETGDPVPSDETTGLSSLLADWSTFAAKTVGRALSVFSAAGLSADADALSLFDDGRKVSMAALLAEASTTGTGQFSSGLDALVASERRLFIARRTGDILSLRKQSEDESASKIAARLASETLAGCASGIEALSARLDAAAALPSDVEVSGSDWLTAYRTEFDRGLVAWKGAEQRLLERRIEWEQRSGADWNEGMEAWAEGFRRLEEERLAWETKVSGIFSRGEAVFDACSAELEARIASARSEFVKEATLSLSLSSDSASALGEKWTAANGLAASAASSLSLWLSKLSWNEARDGAVGSAAFEKWLKKLGSSAASDVGGKKNAVAEIRTWIDLKARYEAAAADASAALVADFSDLTVGDSLGSLNPEGSLDEYQVELIRSRAVVAWWERRLSIAEAVAEYAGNRTSSRDTEAETSRALEAARAAYGELQAQWEASESSLSASSARVAEARASLDRALADLAASDESLEALNREYALKTAALVLKERERLAASIADAWDSLVSVDGYLASTSDTSLVSRYLEAGTAEGSSEVLASASSALSGLFVDLSSLSLSELERRLDAIALFSCDDAAGWYQARTGGTLGSDRLEDRLLSDLNRANAALETATAAAVAASSATGDSSGDATAEALSVEVATREVERRAALLEVVSSCADSVPFLVAERQQRAQGLFQTAFLPLGLTASVSSIPAVEGVLTAIASSSLGFEAALTAFLADSSEAIPFLLPWQAAALGRWQKELVRLAAEQALREGLSPSRTASDLQALLEGSSGDEGRGTELLRALLDFSEAYECTLRAAGSTSASSQQVTWQAAVFAQGFDPRSASSYDQSATLCRVLSAPSGPDSSLLEALKERARQALADPQSVDEAYAGETASAFAVFPSVSGDFLDRSGILSSWEEKAESLKSTLALLGTQFAASATPAAILAEVKALKARIDAAVSLSASLMEAAGQESDRIEALGTVWTGEYEASKLLWKEVDAARLEWEKATAIRNWAATSYLSASGDAVPGYQSPVEALASIREGLVRSRASLDVLSGLYAGLSADRPYDDPAYAALYTRYRADAERMALCRKAQKSLSRLLEKEMAENEALHTAWLEASSISPLSLDGIKVRLDERGRLRLVQTASEAEMADADLTAWCSVSARGPGDLHETTSLERAARDWSARMNARKLDAAGLETWALARDYLVSTLTDTSLGITTADNLRSTVGSLKMSGDDLGDWMDGYRKKTLPGLRQEAWNSLSPDERADLEFWILLSTTAAGPLADSAAALETASELYEYRNLDGRVARYISSEKKTARSRFKTAAALTATAAVVWSGAGYFLAAAAAATASGLWHRNEYRTWGDIRKGYAAGRDQTAARFKAGASALLGYISAADSGYTAYAASSARVQALQGITSGASSLSWASLDAALTATGALSSAERTALQGYWQDLSADGQSFTDSLSALKWLEKASLGALLDTADGLEASWSGAERERSAAETEYRLQADSFISGSCDRSTLEAAALRAYGPSAPSRRVHLARLGSLLQTTALDPENPEGVAAWTELLQRAATARCEAELSAREAEWDIERRAIVVRREEWRAASELILERGRADWITGADDLRSRFAAWESRFLKDRKAEEESLNLASLDLARKKASWVNRAGEEASGAARENLLSLVGSSAEDAAREVDLLASAMPHSTASRLSLELESSLAQIRRMAGIDRSLSAMEASMSLAPETVLLQNRSAAPLDVGSARLKLASAEYLRDANRELADRNAAALAASVGEGVAKALAALSSSVDAANAGVRRSLEETFLEGGKWRRSGAAYQKDVVVHSTVADPVITERATVEGYRNFVLRDPGIDTDFSSVQIAGFSSASVDALIAGAQAEVARLGDEVFGTEIEQSAEGREARRHCIEQWEADPLSFFGGSEGRRLVSTDSRYEDAGTFGAWVGYDPVVKKKPSVDDGMRGVFADRGTGEIGRLLSSFIYWSMKESQGWAMVGVPVYDKGMWDDRGSYFKAPSIHQTVSFTVGLAAGICTGGIGAFAVGLADEACFSALDLYTGNKTWEEAGIAFGKRAATGAVSMGVGYGFDAWSAGLSSSGFGGVLERSLLAGGRGLSTGLASSAVGAVEWNGSGLSFNAGAFADGAGSSLIAGATGCAGSLTAGSLGLLDLYDGNGDALSGKVFKVEDIAAFNDLAGALAGQGVGVAFGEDLSLNLLDLSILGNENLSGGLLELNIGRDGARMSLGSGGLNLSAASLWDSFSGLRETLKTGSAKLSALTGDEKDLAILNAVNKLAYSSDSADVEIARRIWGDELAVNFVDMAGRGAFDSTNPSSIEIWANMGGTGRIDAVNLATLLSHEGSHADGNHVESLAYLKALALNGELSQTFGLEGDSALRSEMVAGILNEENWNENASAREYWELVCTDTRILARFDGRKDLRTPDGKLLAPASDADDAEKVNFAILKELQTRYPDGMPATIDAYYSSLLSSYNRQASVTAADRKKAGGTLDGLAAFFDTHGGKGTWNESFTMSTITDRSTLKRVYGLDALSGSLEQGLSIDVTDLFMRESNLFSREAKRELAGNRKLVGDALFSLIERPLLTAATIDVAQNLVLSPDTACRAASLDFGCTAVSGQLLLRDLLGIGVADDAYDARAREFYAAASADILLNAKALAKSFSFEDQNTLSNALNWGFLTVTKDPDSAWKLNENGERTSSLCHALSIITACELNSMVDTTEQDKEAFLKWARGKGLILRNGLVNTTPAAFAQAYRNYLIYEKDDSILALKAASSYGLSGRFLVGRHKGFHSAVLDAASSPDADGLMADFYNPWKKNNWGDEFLYVAYGRFK